MPTLDSEREFLRLLGIFERQTAEATQFVFGKEAINEMALRNRRVHNAMNLTPMFWNTVAGAFQHAGIIAVGRVFDRSRGQPRTVHALLQYVQDHRDLFSKGAISARKTRGGLDAKWLPGLLERVHPPTNADFHRIDTLVAKYAVLYEAQFKDLRNKYFAHSDPIGEADVAEMFAKTRKRDLERVVTFLNQLHQALWQMFHNGSRLRLRPMPSSPRSLVRRSAKDRRDRTAQERMVADTKTVLRLLTKAAAGVAPVRPVRVRKGKATYLVMHR